MFSGRYIVLMMLLLCGERSLHAGQAVTRLPDTTPKAVGMDPVRLARIDAVVNDAIKRQQLPGAVVLVLRQGKIVFRKAYGHRSLVPQRHKMTLDTIFDLASLTKPIVTATSIMMLLEQGKLRPRDTRYLPEYVDKKRRVSIRHLLLHTSGLIPDNALSDYGDGAKMAWQRLMLLRPLVEPGSKFMYSDVGYMLLGKVVEKISNDSLDEFAHKHIFQPLGMKDTAFRLTKEQAGRAAPTEKRAGKWLQGTVHDPRAARLGGVAGHAGLFSTADDLAVFCQMLLNRGKFAGKTILSPAAVRLMTTPHKVPGGLRALGWDVDTGYSSNRGELFPVGGFGHSGFTGTSLWIDPPSETAVIFLSNRVHPYGKGNVIRLRNQVATLVAASIVAPPLWADGTHRHSSTGHK